MERGAQAHRPHRHPADGRPVAPRRSTSPRRCGCSTSDGASPVRSVGPGTPRSSSGCDPERDDDLLEWDYGDFEGLTTAEIRERAPGMVGVDPPGHRRRDHRAGRRPRRPGDRPCARPRWGRPRSSPTHTCCASSPRGGSNCPRSKGADSRLDNTTISVLGWERENRVIAAVERSVRSVLVAPLDGADRPHCRYQAISGSP